MFHKYEVIRGSSILTPYETPYNKLRYLLFVFKCLFKPNTKPLHLRGSLCARMWDLRYAIEVNVRLQIAHFGVSESPIRPTFSISA